jgi:hypothetical protein
MLNVSGGETARFRAQLRQPPQDKNLIQDGLTLQTYADRIYGSTPL